LFPDTIDLIIAKLPPMTATPPLYDTAEFRWIVAVSSVSVVELA